MATILFFNTIFFYISIRIYEKNQKVEFVKKWHSRQLGSSDLKKHFFDPMAIYFVFTF